MRTFTKVPPSKLKANPFPLKKQKGQSRYLEHFELDPEKLKKHLIQVENEDDMSGSRGPIEHEEAVMDKSLFYSYVGDKDGRLKDLVDENELEQDKELENKLNNNVKFENWKYSTTVQAKETFKLEDRLILAYNSNSSLMKVDSVDFCEFVPLNEGLMKYLENQNQMAENFQEKEN